MINMSAQEFRERFGTAKKASKYRNEKTELDGIVFDSKREAQRYAELKQMERAGIIHDLKRQERYELIPSIRENGKVVQRAVSYIADFTYLDNDGTGWRKVVEDSKGMRTDVYRLKKKLMRWRYGIDIQEV